MSYPIPTVDPNEVYPEDNVTAYANEGMHPNALPDCLDCDGTGFISTPAFQYGGEIVDEVVRPCVCTLTDDDYDI